MKSAARYCTLYTVRSPDVTPDVTEQNARYFFGDSELPLRIFGHAVELSKLPLRPTLDIDAEDDVIIDVTELGDDGSELYAQVCVCLCVCVCVCVCVRMCVCTCARVRI